MGLFGRAMLVIKAKLSRLIGRAENPTETLDYSYEQQLQLLQNVKRGVADVTTAKKRLQLQTAKLEQDLVKLEEQARQALAAGREDLARRALERKSGIQQQLRELDGQVQQLEAQQQKLVEDERTLAARVEAFRSQKEVMKAQYSAAEAQVRTREAVTGIGSKMHDTALAIDRIRERTEEMEARAAAMDELVETGTLEEITAGGRSDLDRELAAMASDQQVESDMARLKAELGSGGAKKELESET